MPAMASSRCALIRHYLHIDPDVLNEEDWASALTQSLWLENRYMDVMKSSIASALSGKDG